MRRWIVWAPLAGLAALAVLFVGFGLRHDPHVNPSALVGHAMPQTPLALLDGGPPLPAPAQVKGPVLVNFFASWCVPCAEEHPGLMALKADGAPIVGVAYEDNAAAIHSFLAARGDPFVKVLMDPKGAAGVDWGVSGVPETFAIDARGVIAAKHTGPLSPADAESLLERAGGR